MVYFPCDVCTAHLYQVMAFPMFFWAFTNISNALPVLHGRPIVQELLVNLLRVNICHSHNVWSRVLLTAWITHFSTPLLFLAGLMIKPA